MCLIFSISLSSSYFYRKINKLRRRAMTLKVSGFRSIYGQGDYICNKTLTTGAGEFSSIFRKAREGENPKATIDKSNTVHLK